MAAIKKKANPVNWFEIPVKNLGRARKFYEKVFNRKLTLENMDAFKMAFFPMANGVPGASGALIKGATYEPSQVGTVVYFTVDDIDGTLRKINKNGGTTMLPKKSIGQYGFIAHFIDTEGNRLALHAFK